MRRILQLLDELREELEGMEKVNAAQEIISEYIDEMEEVFYSLAEENPFDDF